MFHMKEINKKRVKPIKAKVNITFTDVTGREETPIEGDVIRDRMGIIREAMGVDDLPKEENAQLLEKVSADNEPDCCGNTQHKDYVINVEVNEMSTNKPSINVCGCNKGNVPAMVHIEIPPTVYLLAKEFFNSCGLTEDVSVTHYSGNDFVIGKDADNELTLALFVTAAAYARYIYEAFGYKVADNLEIHKRIFIDIATAITSQYLQKFAEEGVRECEDCAYDNTYCDECCDFCSDYCYD